MPRSKTSPWGERPFVPSLNAVQRWDWKSAKAREAARIKAQEEAKAAVKAKVAT